MNEMAFAIGSGAAMVVLLCSIMYALDRWDGVKIVFGAIGIMIVALSTIFGVGLLCGWLWR